MKAPTVRTAAAVRVIWASYSRGSTDATARSSSTACGFRSRVLERLIPRASSA